MGTDSDEVSCATLPVISLAFCALPHSLTLCPCPPQYRQRPRTICWSCLVCINPPWAVRWCVMGGELGVSWATEVAEVEGAPANVLCALGAGVAWVVLVPEFRWASWWISTCHSQYHWSMFCTRHFHLLNAAGSSTSTSESLMWSGSACFNRWWMCDLPSWPGSKVYWNQWGNQQTFGWSACWVQPPRWLPHSGLQTFCGALQWSVANHLANWGGWNQLCLHLQVVCWSGTGQTHASRIMCS